MAHVFIVDDKTFQTHLKYSFAGTGARDFKCDFLCNDNNVHHSIERLLCGMIADVSRIRPGDDILFYLQQSEKHEGMFFGSFKACERSFLCNDDYLLDELSKNLTFRLEIVPSTVYENGITERECLDSLEGIKHPSDMCWSLIYRKLKANRGCTMITDAEYSFIMKKLKSKNNKVLSNFTGLEFDPIKTKIIKTNEKLKYLGKKESLNIFDRLYLKYKDKKAYECHLQAYIMQNLDEIEKLKINNKEISWIGNEMSCGVGMQSIDAIFIQKDKTSINIVICELKDEQPISYIKDQLYKYIDWLRQYIVPTYKCKVRIYPTIVAPVPSTKTTEMLKEINISFQIKNKNMIVEKTRYISFSINNKELIFNEEII